MDDLLIKIWEALVQIQGEYKEEVERGEMISATAVWNDIQSIKDMMDSQYFNPIKPTEVK